MQIIKRSGAEAPFDKEKIVAAITKANASVEEAERIPEGRIRWIADRIAAEATGATRAMSVEEVQDKVEESLMSDGYFSLARNYITYRYEHAKLREDNALMEKLTASNVQNQNANVDETSFSGRMGETLSLITKKFALEHLMSPKSARNHVNNEIYIHDLDSYAVGMHNCLSIPFDKLLAEGFTVRQCDVRPAGSINTALQLVAVIFQLQSLQQFGGVSATHLDWTLVPYVRKSFSKHYQDGAKYIAGLGNPELPVNRDISIESEAYKSLPKVYQYAMDMTIKELNQAVEGLYHNLNTLQSRSGGQLPFTSINYGTCTLPEGRMVIKALLDGSIKGVGKFHKTPIFPCGIFQCMKGVNRKPGDPNYDLFRLALKSTSLRLYPNYGACNWSVDEAALKQDREAKQKVLDELSDVDRRSLFSRLEESPWLMNPLMIEVASVKNFRVAMDRKPFEIASFMGCRTYNGFDINSTDSYKANIEQVIKNGTLYDNVESGAAKDGRGNICPCSLILPELAMQAKSRAEASGTDIVDEFMAILDRKIGEAKDMLIERFDWICSQSPASARFMYENGTMYGYKSEEGIRSALKHGTLAIGQLGLAETLQILVGCDHTEEKGMALAKRIEQLFKDRCAEFKQKYRLNFGVYYTPAENLCYTAMKKFKAKHGVIPKVSDREFMTNSIHCPVWHKLTPFEKIDIESQLTGYSSAGCITYVELDSSVQNNLDALEDLVNYAMDKDIPYFAINVPADSCEDCGWQGDIPGKCPKCGSENIQRLRRVTGYLTGNFKTAFNAGKIQETEMREKHNGVEA